ncbi:MAG: hypothetical protein OXH76_03845 [Boseongicola sp.]|nr:hypothetical protein [Boseongicola sp.]
MKSNKTLATAMLAAAMLAGGGNAAESPAPTTVAEAKSVVVGKDRLPTHADPPGNVPADALRELLAGSVMVSRHLELESQLPRGSLQIVFTDRDGRVEMCTQLLPFLPTAALRWAWTTGMARSESGVVQPVIRLVGKTRLVEGEGVALSVLHDGETGEAVWHEFRRGTFEDWKSRFLGHMQERLPAATWALCPDFPSAEELGVDVNHAQTAVEYDALVAQDPGRRIRRADLVTTEMEGDGSLPAWITRIMERWRAADGRALGDWADDNQLPTSETFVYYEPLSALWLFDVAHPEEAAGAPLEEAGIATWVIDADGQDALLVFDRAELRERERYERDTWEFRWPRLLPELVTAIERHPLAVKHDRLLSGALVREFAGLPAGSRFATDGTVQLSEPQSSGKAPAWESKGEVIEIGRRFGLQAVEVPLNELLSAME